MSYREEEEWCGGGEVEDYSCPLCCTLTKYLLVLLLVVFFLVTPALMIYTSITHQSCDDIFLAWLTAGRIRKPLGDKFSAPSYHTKYAS